MENSILYVFLQLFWNLLFRIVSIKLLKSTIPWCSIGLTSRMKRNKVEQPRTVQRVQCRAARQREQHLHWRRSSYIYIWNNDVMTEVSCSSGLTGLLQTVLLHDHCHHSTGPLNLHWLLSLYWLNYKIVSTTANITTCHFNSKPAACGARPSSKLWATESCALRIRRTVWLVWFVWAAWSVATE